MFNAALMSMFAALTALKLDDQGDPEGDQLSVKLCRAVVKDRKKEVKQLLASRADPNRAVHNVSGRTKQTPHATAAPLIFAAHNAALQSMPLLIKARADVNRRNSTGASPLFCASQEGTLASVKMLYDAGADPNQLKHILGTDPVAMGLSQVPVDGSLPVAGRAGGGASPLFIATWFGHTSVVAFLLENGADPNLANDDGDTPLVCALVEHPALVKLLRKHGAKAPGAEEQALLDNMEGAV